MDVVIERTVFFSAESLAGLVAESEHDGLRFVRRLADDFASGANLFDRDGECLFTARAGELIVGVCGLNVDPYLDDDSVGRVRRLYVAKSVRGSGIGTLLLDAVVSAAQGRFRELRVRTENSAAGALYEQFGFTADLGAVDCTHRLDLANASQSTARI